MYILITLIHGKNKFCTFKSANCRATLNAWQEWANQYMNEHLDDSQEVYFERDNGDSFWQEPEFETFADFKKNNQAYKDANEVTLEKLCSI